MKDAQCNQFPTSIYSIDNNKDEMKILVVFCCRHNYITNLEPNDKTSLTLRWNFKMVFPKLFFRVKCFYSTSK